MGTKKQKGMSTPPANKKIDDSTTVGVILLLSESERAERAIKAEIKRLDAAGISVSYTVPADTITDVIIIGKEQDLLDRYNQKGLGVPTVHINGNNKQARIQAVVDAMLNKGQCASWHETSGRATPVFTFLKLPSASHVHDMVSAPLSTSAPRATPPPTETVPDAGPACFINRDNVLYYNGESAPNQTGQHTLSQGTVDEYIKSLEGLITQYTPTTAGRLKLTLNNINQFYTRHIRPKHPPAKWYQFGLLRLNKEGVWSTAQLKQLKTLKSISFELVKKAKGQSGWRDTIYSSDIFKHQQADRTVGLVQLNRSRYEFFCCRWDNFVRKETTTAKRVSKLLK